MDTTHLPVVNETEGGASTPGEFKTTLAEQGAQLPVGIRTTPGELSKGFSVRPWKTKDERELAKHKTPDMSLARYVSLIVGAMTERIGPHDFTVMKPAERAVIIAQMYMGDVFYVYCYLRHQTLGKSLRVNFQCEHCAQKIPYDADLDTLEVKTVEREEELAWAYELQDPIEIRGKKVTKFQMGAMRWTTMETTAAMNVGTDAIAKIAAIRGSIVALNDDTEHVVVADSEMDELSKFDLEHLADQINEHFVGPNMSIEDTCKPDFCPRGGGMEFRIGIDWSYDSFFGISSR